MDERRAQLIAAAEAVRTWVYEQRAAWPSRSADLDAAPASSYTQFDAPVPPRQAYYEPEVVAPYVPPPPAVVAPPPPVPVPQVVVAPTLAAPSAVVAAPAAAPEAFAYEYGKL